MGLEDIKEVKECTILSEVNDLLRGGNWRLIEPGFIVSREKSEERVVGMDFHPGGENYLNQSRIEIVYTDRVKYILGRYK